MKQKALSMLLCLAMIFTSAITMALPVYAEGSSTETTKTIMFGNKQVVVGGANWSADVNIEWYDSSKSVFSIRTAAELAGLAQLVRSGTTFIGKTVQLTADIDLGFRPWTPIGYSNARSFRGEFDGNGHVISNLYINGSDGNKQGLFGVIGCGSAGTPRSGAHLHDFAIQNTIFENTNGNIGVVAGSAFHDCVLENITVDTAMLSGQTPVAAICAGVQSSQFKNILAKNITITAKSVGTNGGIFGTIQGQISSLSYFAPSVDKNSTNYCIPGTLLSTNQPLVSYFENVDAQNITITIDSANSNCYFGGFAGYSLDTLSGDRAIFMDCNISNLEIKIVESSGTPRVGGFIGLRSATAHYAGTNSEGKPINFGHFEGCSVSGKISVGCGYVGGFVGQSAPYGGKTLAPVTYQNVTTDVDLVVGANAIAGGFIGQANTTGLSATTAKEIQNFYACTVLGTTQIGNNSAEESYFLGELSTNSTKGVTFVGCYVGNKTDDSAPLFKINSAVKEPQILPAIIFNTNTNGTIAPILQAVGTPVTAPTTALTKIGHTFAGWDPEIPTTMPGESITVKAKWTPNKYTITFDTNGGSVIAPITQDYGTDIIAPADPTKTGYTFAGWDTVIPATMPVDGLTVKANWNINQYTITFDTDGSSAIAPITQDYGTDITTPADPVKTGYTFAGWEPEIPSTMPGESITVKAKWTPNKYTITFDTNGGSVIAPITQDYGTDIIAPADPTKTGYTFAGWDTVIPATMPVDGLTVKANWNINQYAITFDTDGGSAIAPITQDYGTAIAAPADPTKTGYTFAGWDTVIPATMPAESITVKAKWTTNEYGIYFDTDGGSKIDPILQDYGTAITAPADPTKTGYTFVGWDTAIPETMPAESITIKAKWKINQYTVTFDTDGGSEIAPITQNYGTAITAPADPTKTGYTFVGWDTVIPETMPAESVTIKAKWTTNEYGIYFDTDGGSKIDPILQDYGTAITAPADPTKTGYTFAGWDTAIPETMPAESITIKAKWIANEYTITFDTDGGSEIAPITQNYGTAITAPANPTKIGYTFIGWDIEIPETMPAENITVKAIWGTKFLPRTYYSVCFRADHRMYIIRYYKGATELTVIPKVPEKEGYIGTWEEYELDNKSIVIHAVYTPIITTAD